MLNAPTPKLQPHLKCLPGLRSVALRLMLSTHTDSSTMSRACDGLNSLSFHPSCRLSGRLSGCWFPIPSPAMFGSGPSATLKRIHRVDDPSSDFGDPKPSRPSSSTKMSGTCNPGAPNMRTAVLRSMCFLNLLLQYLPLYNFASYFFIHALQPRSPSKELSQPRGWMYQNPSARKAAFRHPEPRLKVHPTYLRLLLSLMML
ncbi:hypothetical protein L249_7382 [Ophiocordyceps polyrhachis-furcata BCC 54312]|uniref:Uncharacterized protein n=1 Tax=Ophiocordyceps polyrhachis-furcata BCC 54312 TaxID=1330021 RepID=A0A367LBI4_9HYPO|nr:hypothetical protein L249_7382 [Ophiocordyceps polyrhachis-furcata BCC 54312]